MHVGVDCIYFVVSVASFSHEISNGSNGLNMVGALFVSKKSVIAITMTCPEKMGVVLISEIYIHKVFLVEFVGSLVLRYYEVTENSLVGFPSQFSWLRKIFCMETISPWLFQLWKIFKKITRASKTITIIDLEEHFMSVVSELFFWWDGLGPGNHPLDGLGSREGGPQWNIMRWTSRSCCVWRFKYISHKNINPER